MWLMIFSAKVLAWLMSTSGLMMANSSPPNRATVSEVRKQVFSREEILERNPDYIIIPTGGDENISDIEKLYPEWKNLEAIENKHVLFVNRDLYSRPGSRFVEAVEDLYSRLRH